jgi:hypothetical protein
MTSPLVAAFRAASLAAIIFAALPFAAHGEDILTVTVVIKDGRLNPQIIEVPANTRFKIVIRNEGPGPAEFESRDLRREKVLNAGSTSFVVIGPQKPGVYDMFDDFHPRTGRGRIIVK